MMRLRRAVVARAFAEWVDDTREGAGGDRRPGAEEGLSASERREVRAEIRDAEWLREWARWMTGLNRGAEESG